MYVYIISNEAFDGWLKVGKTAQIKRRMSTMQTGAPTEYVVELLVKFFDDKPIHNKLEALGIERKGEWFKASMADVRSVVLATVSEWERTRAADPTGKNQAEVLHEGVNLTGLEPVSRRNQACLSTSQQGSELTH